MKTETVKASILTPWTGSGSQADPNRPLVIDLYPLISWIDATAQPSTELRPDPNLFAIEAEIEPAVLAQLETDPLFYVLWSD